MVTFPFSLEALRLAALFVFCIYIFAMLDCVVYKLVWYKRMSIRLLVAVPFAYGSIYVIYYLAIFIQNILNHIK